MLTLGEIELFRGLGWGKEKPNHFKECSVCQGRFFAEDCEFDEKPEKYREVKLAIWHAGGNWGNLWPHVHKSRLESYSPILKSGKTILGMPQSFHYDLDTNRPQPEVDTLKMRQLIAEGLGMKDHTELDTDAGRELSKSRIILTWREQKSYDAAVSLYPFVTHRLMPDIAFQLGPFLPSMRPDTPLFGNALRGGGPTIEKPVTHRILPDKVDLLLFMRTDFESQTATQQEIKSGNGGRRSEQFVRNYLDNLPNGRGQGVTFLIVDWEDRYDLFGDSFTLTSQTSVDLLHLGRVAVVDRLHAAILSFLSDEPFVYIDQRTKKLSSTLGVAMSAWEGCQDEDTLMYHKAEDLEDGIDKALDMLHKNGLRLVNDGRR